MKFVLSELDPQLRPLGALLQPITQVHSPQMFRTVQKGYRAVFHGKRPKSRDVVFAEKMITGKDGDPIRLCIYRPTNFDRTQPVTGLLWLHGGGYANGLPEQELPMIEAFIHTHPTVVIAPDYRLSIDAPFPAALEDAYVSLLWLKQNATALGIDPRQLFIGGESAGGGLAACLSAYARDKGEVAIAYQMPLYPMLDDRMMTPSMTDNNGPVWNITSNWTAWQLYLGEAFGTDQVSPYAAPTRLTDHHDLPPTYTFVGAHEPFHDETLAYIAALKQAGIAADVDVYPGVYHAFDILQPHAHVSELSRATLMRHYAAATQQYFKPQP